MGAGFECESAGACLRTGPLKAEDTFTTLNVDGGVTDNDPFQLAHDFLAVHNPKAFPDPETGELRNPPDSDQANAAVLTVAPFPADEFFHPDYDFDQNMSIFGMLPNLFTALISQSRFLGESLAAVMSGESCSRFVLAPSDAGLPNKKALQCGLLGAFGGFFERGFRAHDYQLGRRNCQKFLKDYFRLAVTNPVIEAGLNQLDEQTRNEVIGDFASLAQGQENTVPIIPLCGSAAAEVPEPERAKITMTRLGHVLNWIVDRLHAVSKPLIGSVVTSDFNLWAAQSALDTLISTWGRAKLREVLETQLKEVIEP